MASAAEAWDAAEGIGLPVVVKPSDGNHARGVSLNLHTHQEIEDAFAAAEKEGSEVIVERFIPGQEHRLLVVGGKVVAATRGEITRVSGDGRSAIAQLIDTQVNSDPRRGAEEQFPLDVILVHENPVTQLELQRQGLTADSVLRRGQTAVVERTGNMANDVTGLVHPDIAEQMGLAARVVGLDIAGIDLVCEDIGRPSTRRDHARLKRRRLSPSTRASRPSPTTAGWRRRCCSFMAGRPPWPAATACSWAGGNCRRTARWASSPASAC